MMLSDISCVDFCARQTAVRWSDNAWNSSLQDVGSSGWTLYVDRHRSRRLFHTARIRCKFGFTVIRRFMQKWPLTKSPLKSGRHAMGRKFKSPPRNYADSLTPLRDYAVLRILQFCSVWNTLL